MPSGGPVLSIDEAIALARRNNPRFQRASLERRNASASLRSARGAFLPNVDASFGSTYREGRPQFFGGQAFGSSADIVSSSYDLSVSARYNASTLLTPKLARANLIAAEADVAGGDQILRADVAQQYLTVLQQQARAVLQDTLLAAARSQLGLATARVAAGAGTSLDVRRAEVAVGQARVALIQARNGVEVEKLRLFQLMGVNQPANVQLTSAFTVSALSMSIDELLRLAQTSPVVEAAGARERAAAVGHRVARSQYSPTLFLSTGWGGFTNQFTDDNFVVDQALQSKRSPCFATEQTRAIVENRQPDFSGCSAVVLTPQESSRARSLNSSYPFSFQRNPWQLQAVISVPVFNGFAREAQVQQASVTRENARNARREAELNATATVTTAYLNLTSATETVKIQEQNALTAREALTLAEQRFRVGAGTFIDVTQARADFERAETDRINAIYDYHKAFAALESAVGRPLR